MYGKMSVMQVIQQNHIKRVIIFSFYAIDSTHKFIKKNVINNLVRVIKNVECDFKFFKVTFFTLIYRKSLLICTV